MGRSAISQHDSPPGRWMMRDFQRYAGRAPTSLLRDQMPDADSIVVA